MEGVDLELEELLVAKAVGLSLHGLDLVVGSLQWSRRDAIVVVGQDAQGQRISNSIQ